VLTLTKFKARAQENSRMADKKQCLTWQEALKAFNANSNTWCIPRKNTPEHEAVKLLQKGEALQTTKNAKSNKKATKSFNGNKKAPVKYFWPESAATIENDTDGMDTEEEEQLRLDQNDLDGMDTDEENEQEVLTENFAVNKYKAYQDEHKVPEVTDPKLLKPYFDNAGFVWEDLYIGQVKNKSQGKSLGYGVFAKNKLRPGTTIPVIGVSNKFHKLDQSKQTHSIMFNGVTYDGHPSIKPYNRVGLKGLAIALMLNESNNPNCYFTENNFLVLIRPVRPDQQLTTYYGEKYVRDYNIDLVDGWPQKGKPKPAGSPKQRKHLLDVLNHEVEKILHTFPQNKRKRETKEKSKKKKDIALSAQMTQQPKPDGVFFGAAPLTEKTAGVFFGAASPSKSNQLTVTRGSKTKAPAKVVDNNEKLKRLKKNKNQTTRPLSEEDWLADDDEDYIGLEASRALQAVRQARIYGYDMEAAKTDNPSKFSRDIRFNRIFDDNELGPSEQLPEEESFYR